MLETLWHNPQRHAQGDGRIHDVSRDEAETAVGPVVTIVQWFSAGLVAPT